jgi:hypothetical protein
MRKIIVAFIFLCVTHVAFSQWTGPDASGRIYYQSGQVGIGLVPTSKLHVKSTETTPIVQMETNDANMTFVRHWLELKPKSTFTNTPYIAWYVPSGLRQGYIGWRTDCFNLTLENGYNFSIYGGNVGIGVTDTKGFQLAVAGKAVAEEVVVKLRGNWPDYVFDTNYPLLPLTSLAGYIEKNKHLPGIPTKNDVDENGIAVGQMNELLLKKIEELTLYLIEERKISTRLENEIMQLRSEMKNFVLDK